jgi:hypothetical protein
MTSFFRMKQIYCFCTSLYVVEKILQVLCTSYIVLKYLCFVKRLYLHMNKTLEQVSLILFLRKPLYIVCNYKVISPDSFNKLLKL